MGVSFSCPFGEYHDVETALESVVVRSISFGDDECKTPTRSVSCNTAAAEPKMQESLGSSKTIIGSVSFKGRQLETTVTVTASEPGMEDDLSAPSNDPQCKDAEQMHETPVDIRSRNLLTDFAKWDCLEDIACESSLLGLSSPKHKAAIKLQKVYKSFRTRRKLADCAVLVEQSWWKLIDFAELKRSSISFFDIEKHETAISRWSRARTRAAKVGKGLSKNDRAKKLALRHWLEAIDPRHRYGHNLQFYYDNWLQSQSREPFFYWLDIGEGREVNLAERCPRSKLQQQCIKYLGPMERKAYEIILQDGIFIYKQTGELLHSGEDPDAKWIFVLSTSKVLYVGKKKKGTFQHSSFLAGGATVAAGRLIVENGVLQAVWPHSGHYQPTLENFQDFVAFLRENSVDLTNVKMCPMGDEEDLLNKQRSIHHLRNFSSEEDFDQTLNNYLVGGKDAKDGTLVHKLKSGEQETINAVELSESRKFLDQSQMSTNDEPSKRDESFKRLNHENLSVIPNCTNISRCDDGYDSADEQEEEEEEVEQKYKISAHKSFDREDEECEPVKVPKELILKRINSKKETKSYQLAKQISSKWTTGAGPRIGCVRDYPSELQVRALEQVSLSPRSVCATSLYFAPGSSCRLSQTDTSEQSSPEDQTRILRSSSATEKLGLIQRSVPQFGIPSSPLRRGTSLPVDTEI